MNERTYFRETFHEISHGGGSNEQEDSTDQGVITTRDTVEPVKTGIQVAQTLRSQLGLDRDGSFLDPDKYDPVKLLGSGGFAKVLLSLGEFKIKGVMIQEKINGHSEMGRTLRGPCIS